MKQYDVIIIGAGVSGCAAARELAKRQRRIAVLERASDVCEGTSKANSGIVLKAKLNVLGNRKMEQLAKELDFPFRRNGSLVLCFEKDGMSGLEELMERGQKNGVEGLQILTPEQVWQMEPNISKEIVGALYAPTGGTVCPFGLNIALAENAAENGVEFYLGCEVTGIKKMKSDTNVTNKEAVGYTYIVATGEEQFQAPS